MEEDTCRTCGSPAGDDHTCNPSTEEETDDELSEEDMSTGDASEEESVDDETDDMDGV